MANLAAPPPDSARGPESGALVRIAVALAFLAAILAGASAPGAGPVKWIALAILAGAGAALVALPSLRRARTVPALDAEAGAVVAALSEPAALVADDGRVLAANDAWKRLAGADKRLERTAVGGAHGLLRGAARDGRAAEPSAIGAEGARLEAARLAGGRFLVGMLAPPVAPAADAMAAPPAVEPAAPARLDDFAAASPFGAALIEGEDPFEGAILETNAAWAGIAGSGAGPGGTLGSLLADKGRAEAAAQFAAGGAGPFEVAPAARPDSAAHLYVTRLRGRSIAYLVDVTEQKLLQAQLVQANKMQAVGQLAGGVAHDFNNVLSAIMLNLNELTLRHPLGDPTYEGLAQIRNDALRAAGLVNQLLTFSRKATVQRETLDVGEVINNVTVMLRQLLPENVKMDTAYGRNLPLVRADRQQLENAVMNLVVNARDALRGAGGGHITVRAARVGEAEAVSLGYEGAPMGEMALIEVADDGPGIPPDVQMKIFEPFFTTKPVGEGTGLGLATVYGIVKQSDGWIALASKPGEGATFRIFLPVYDPPVLVEPPVPAPPKGRAAARDLSGVGRILFVEDEISVRRIAARLLRARGYEVLEASDGEEALALAEENAGAIDLMISDVIMPGMDGPTLLKQARGCLGDAPVLFISGYAEAVKRLLKGE